jgi:hypothetical protein
VKKCLTRHGRERFIVDDATHDVERIVSAEANHSNAASTERRGKCDDRIHEIHFNTQTKKSTDDSVLSPISRVAKTILV